MFKVIYFGDVVGRVGRVVISSVIPEYRKTESADLVIVNGENAAGGVGIDQKTAEEIFAAGVDLISTGNHVWSKKDFVPYLNSNAHRVVRPLNFPNGAPGKGFTVWTSQSGVKVCLINLLGRVFIPDLVDSPFAVVDNLIKNESLNNVIKIVDFHAEATSEKIAMGYFLDSRVSAVVGTHTHVQTADEKILPGGTAFICDLGMCGPYHSVLGMSPELIVRRFTTALPVKFELAKGSAILNGVVISIDEETGVATEIKRINRVVDL